MRKIKMYCIVFILFIFIYSVIATEDGNNRLQYKHTVFYSLPVSLTDATTLMPIDLVINKAETLHNSCFVIGLDIPRHPVTASSYGLAFMIRCAFTFNRFTCKQLLATR